MTRATRAALAVVLVVIIAIVFAVNVRAAPRETTVCGWDGSTLRASGLPDEYAVTAEFYPTGVTAGPDPLALTFDAPFAVWFWTRGGPGMPDAPKPGPQLNDYKVICIAT